MLTLETEEAEVDVREAVEHAAVAGALEEKMELRTQCTSTGSIEECAEICAIMGSALGETSASTPMTPS